MTQTIYSKRPYLWPLGPGGLVQPDRVVAVGAWSSAPIRRAARFAKSEGRLVDLTYGKATKWVLFLDSGHIVLTSAPMPVTAVEMSDEEIEALEEAFPWEK